MFVFGLQGEYLLKDRLLMNRSLYGQLLTKYGAVDSLRSIVSIEEPILLRSPVTVCLDKSSCLDLIKNMQMKYYYLNFHSTCTSFHNASEVCLIPSEIVSVCIFILYITL